MDLNNALNRELSKPHHDINVYNKDGLMLGSNRGAYEDLREYRGAPRPGLDHLLVAGSVHGVDLL